MPKNPLGRLTNSNGPQAGPVPRPTPVDPGALVKPTRPTDQGNRKPSADVAKDILGTLLKRPSDIPVPEDLPTGYDRMDEVTKANAASGLARAFSGGVPAGWKPVDNNPEPVTPEPSIVEAINPSD